MIWRVYRTSLHSKTVANTLGMKANFSIHHVLSLLHVDTSLRRNFALFLGEIVGTKYEARLLS